MASVSLSKPTQYPPGPISAGLSYLWALLITQLQNTLPLFHHLLSISIYNLFSWSSPAKGIKPTKICSSFLSVILSSSHIIIKCTLVLNTMNGIISCACGVFFVPECEKHRMRSEAKPNVPVLYSRARSIICCADGKYLLTAQSTSNLKTYAHHLVLGLNAVIHECDPIW